jgi:hypothetical protein
MDEGGRESERFGEEQLFLACTKALGASTLCTTPRLLCAHHTGWELKLLDLADRTELALRYGLGGEGGGGGGC